MSRAHHLQQRARSLHRRGPRKTVAEGCRHGRAGTGASAVAFDHSGLYMAVGGADARVYGVKQDWEVVKTFPDMPKKVRADGLGLPVCRPFCEERPVSWASRSAESWGRTSICTACLTLSETLTAETKPTSPD
jgi:hypothetical protein